MTEALTMGLVPTLIEVDNQTKALAERLAKLKQAAQHRSERAAIITNDLKSRLQLIWLDRDNYSHEQNCGKVVVLLDTCEQILVQHQKASIPPPTFLPPQRWNSKLIQQMMLLSGKLYNFENSKSKTTPQNIDADFETLRELNKEDAKSWPGRPSLFNDFTKSLEGRWKYLCLKKIERELDQRDPFCHNIVDAEGHPVVNMEVAIGSIKELRKNLVAMNKLAKWDHYKEELIKRCDTLIETNQMIIEAQTDQEKRKKLLQEGVGTFKQLKEKFDLLQEQLDKFDAEKMDLGKLIDAVASIEDLFLKHQHKYGKPDQIWSFKYKLREVLNKARKKKTEMQLEKAAETKST